MDSTQIGQAGEYLAASVLQRHVKAIAFPDIPTSYDLLVETKSNEFLRCQVKTTDVIWSVNEYDYWRFHAKKESGAYTSKDCDFFRFCNPSGEDCRFCVTRQHHGGTVQGEAR